MVIHHLREKLDEKESVFNLQLLAAWVLISLFSYVTFIFSTSYVLYQLLTFVLISFVWYHIHNEHYFHPLSLSDCTDKGSEDETVMAAEGAFASTQLLTLKMANFKLS